MKKYLKWIYDNCFDLQWIFIIIAGFSSFEIVLLIDEGQDLSYTNITDFDYTDQNKTDTEGNGTVKSTNKMTEFEHKMQKLMSTHMDTYLSDLRKDIQESDQSASNSDPDNKGGMTKEDLENVYYNEVDFKLKVDCLANKLEKELAIKESSSNETSSSNDENIKDNKRTGEDPLDLKNKKTKT